jgi:membrane protein
MSSARGVTPPSELARPGGGAPRRERLDGKGSGGVSGLLRRIDRWQQSRPRVGFVAAVFKKFSDDQGGQLAALISYYGFVSLFPLLLVMVTALGFVLQGDPHERERIINGTLGQFPVISGPLKLHSLSGSVTALAIGIVTALFAGMGIMNATQNAMNRIWQVPFTRRPNWLFTRLRGLGMLAILGTVSIVSIGAGGFVGTSVHQAWAVAAGVVVAFAANLILFMAAFKVLTAEDLDWRTLLPGVVTAAVLWQLLQHLGGYYLDHELKRTGPLYGIFALVLGLLAWLYLGGQLTILAAEVNVVKARALWPRSFFGDPLLPADKRALTASAESQERVEGQDVTVEFRDPE